MSEARPKIRQYLAPPCCTIGRAAAVAPFSSLRIRNSTVHCPAVTQAYRGHPRSQRPSTAAGDNGSSINTPARHLFSFVADDIFVSGRHGRATRRALEGDRQSLTCGWFLHKAPTDVCPLSGLGILRLPASRSVWLILGPASVWRVSATFCTSPAAPLLPIRRSKPRCRVSATVPIAHIVEKE